MATLVLPISELQPVVDQAKLKTECVVVRSRSERANVAGVSVIAVETLFLKFTFGSVVRLQKRAISGLVQRDFSAMSGQEIKSLADSIDRLVAEERELLRKAYGLGSEIRVWWNTSLVRLAAQVEHLDSIAESLHLECDDEASALLGLAADSFVKSKPFEMQSGSRRSALPHHR